MTPIEFARAMRAAGFRYWRMRRGVAGFTRTRMIGGRKAYTSTCVSLELLKRRSLPLEQLVAKLVADSEHRFARLADQVLA